MGRARGSRAATQGALLEKCVEFFRGHRFHMYDSLRQFERADHEDLRRYTIRHYPHDTVYGTPGRKELFISSDDCRSHHLLPTAGGRFECILETKHQGCKGSVDEKLPYVLEACRSSPIMNWLVMFEGAYWKEPRPKSAIEWIKRRAIAISVVENKRLLIFVGIREFNKFVCEAWGRRD